MRKESRTEPLLPPEESRRDPIQLRSAVRFIDELKSLLDDKVKRLRVPDTQDKEVFDVEAGDSEAEAEDMEEIANDEKIDAEFNEESSDEEPRVLVDGKATDIENEAEDENIDDESSGEYPNEAVDYSREPSDEQLAEFFEAEIAQAEDAFGQNIEARSTEESANAGFEESEELTEPESLGTEEAASEDMETEPDEGLPAQLFRISKNSLSLWSLSLWTRKMPPMRWR